MIKGVSFRIPQTKTNTLWNILKCIDVKNYIWHNILSQTEVWCDSNESIFEKHLIEGEDFEKAIQKDHYVVFLKLQAYLTENPFVNIHTYEQFSASDCQIMVLVYDCEFVEIFIKDMRIIENVYKNALVCDYMDLKYITDQNDGRSIMDLR